LTSSSRSSSHWRRIHKGPGRVQRQTRQPRVDENDRRVGTFNGSVNLPQHGRFAVETRIPLRDFASPDAITVSSLPVVLEAPAPKRTVVMRRDKRRRDDVPNKRRVTRHPGDPGMSGRVNPAHRTCCRVRA
jgi:hypothetical protein